MIGAAGGSVSVAARCHIQAASAPLADLNIS